MCRRMYEDSPLLFVHFYLANVVVPTRFVGRFARLILCGGAYPMVIGTRYTRLGVPGSRTGEAPVVETTQDGSQSAHFFFNGSTWREKTILEWKYVGNSHIYSGVHI